MLALSSPRSLTNQCSRPDRARPDRGDPSRGKLRYVWFVATEPLKATASSHYFVRDDGIVVQKVVSSRKQTLEDILANVGAFNEIAEGRKRLLLVDMHVAAAIEAKAREYYATEEASRYVLALALITPSTATRILGNFFLGLNKPAYPCRMFATIEDGVVWLHARAREVASRSASDLELR